MISPSREYGSVRPTHRERMAGPGSTRRQRRGNPPPEPSGTHQVRERSDFPALPRYMKGTARAQKHAEDLLPRRDAHLGREGDNPELRGHEGARVLRWARMRTANRIRTPDPREARQISNDPDPHCAQTEPLQSPAVAPAWSPTEPSATHYCFARLERPKEK